MARKKLSPQNIAIFAGPSPSTGIHTTANIKELFGIQDFNYNTAETKEDIFVFGQKAAVGRESAELPTFSFDLSYYQSDLSNEKRLGMVVDGTSGTFSKIFNGTEDERNFFLMIAADGEDAIGSNAATTPSLGIGNATLSSYNFNAAIGSYPTTSLSFTAIDALYNADSDNNALPAINVLTGEPAAGTYTLPLASGNAPLGRDPVLRPRDIVVDLAGFTGLFYDMSTACVQSLDINVDFGREDQQCLGSKHRRDSAIADSVPLTFSVEFLAKDMITGRLSDFTCKTGTYNGTITIRRPSCNATGPAPIAMLMQLKGLSWSDQSQPFTIGQQSNVTMNFQGTIGGANDPNKGLFTSGIAY